MDGTDYGLLRVCLLLACCLGISSLIRIQARPHPPTNPIAPTIESHAATHGERRAGKRERKGLAALANRSEVVCWISYVGLCCWPLSVNSIQDALRAFFRPTKHGDPRLDFYAMYEKGSTEHDFGLVKKFDADFNTALVFVRFLIPAPPVTYFSFRRVCPPPSVLHSSSLSTRSSSQTQTSNRHTSFVRSSSPSTNPQSRTRPSPSHLSGNTLPVGSPSPSHSCTRVSCFRCSSRSW